jgi:fatty-acyl-CoA synthase
VTSALTLDELVNPIGVDSPLEFVSRGTTVWRASMEAVGRQAGAAAGDLARHGVASGDAVAVTFENDPSSIVLALAVWRAGATLISLPPVPRGQSDNYWLRMSALLRSLGCDVVATRERAYCPEGFTRYPIEQCLSSEASDPNRAAPDRALVQFTSGSLGNPKGVVVTADMLMSNLSDIGRTLNFDSLSDVSMSWLPLYHDMGFVGFFLSTFAARMPQIFATPGSFAVNPSSWLEAVATRRATLTGAPNFAFRMAARAQTPSASLKALRLCLCGGERVHASTIDEFVERFSPLGLDPTAVMPVYGMAEATLAVSFPVRCQTLKSPREPRPSQNWSVSAAGRCCRHTSRQRARCPLSTPTDGTEPAMWDSWRTARCSSSDEPTMW